ncbi:addiction module antitoxin [Candidatus Regiella insecticola LSR1]|uniref:Addiction module antitoxin n=2 Tax=Candidatus Regiella insecticola TaxID=138073 RepID=E0WT69_9ENTR|nr:addiction module antitoxin [Candidatus Regiella insecticola LSR1]
MCRKQERRKNKLDFDIWPQCGYSVVLTHWRDSMVDTIVKARVTPEAKVAAIANAQALGLNLSTVIRMVVNRLAVNVNLPADFFQPNRTTLQVISDLEKGVGVNRVNTVDDLKRDLYSVVMKF